MNISKVEWSDFLPALKKWQPGPIFGSGILILAGLFHSKGYN